MDKSPFVLISGLVFIFFVAGVVSVAAGTSGAQVSFQLLSVDVVVSVFVVCACLVFAINLLAYIPAALAKTEHFYDLVGSISYLSVIIVALYLSGNWQWRSIVVAILVCCWALRLGWFLFQRVRQVGLDDRFDQVKINPLKFLVAWSLQALWVLLTIACALVVITGNNHQPVDLISVIGLLLWLSGFVIEVVADKQKKMFRQNLKNNNKFISSGLWAWSQHPNYFGEIVLWIGMALIALPVLVGWQWLAIISPLFVYLLLTKGSGIPTLEEKAHLKWSNDQDYQHYIKNTPLLFPRIPKS